MIITLKGADFSASNIGTLSTWGIIFTSTGGGATYSGAKYVEKDAAFSGKITIADGYEIGAAGVTVTMGGKNITSAAVTTSGNTITLTIEKVTGTVYIDVLTKKTVVDEEDLSYTITYKYIANSSTIKGETTETVQHGTIKTFSISNAPVISGYTASSVSHTSITVTSDITVTYTYTANSIPAGKTTTTYSNPDWVNVNTGKLSGQTNTWIHSDFIPVSSLSNSDDDGKCVRTFVSHGTVASIAFYSEANFDSYVEGYILTNTVSKSTAQTAEDVKACITKDNANYVVFSTNGANATLSITTGTGSAVTPEPEEPENAASGVNYYDLPGYVKVSNGQVTSSSDWIHSNFIKISDLQDDTDLGHCIGKFTGHSLVADIAFYEANNFDSFIAGKSSATSTQTVETLQSLMIELNATNANYIVISTDKTKNKLYACLK